jgi:hypothetical protein
MLFALPSYQFPYIVMNRCLCLNMWHVGESHNKLAVALMSSFFFVTASCCCWDRGRTTREGCRWYVSYLHAQSIVQNLACPGFDSNDMILSGLELLVQKLQF